MFLLVCTICITSCVLWACDEEPSTPTHTHALVSHEAKAATCTEDGWDAYQTCADCNYSTLTVIDALGHKTVTHNAKAPTCTENGWNAYETCENCDYSTLTVIEATGHKTVTHDAKNPTCTEPGWDVYVTCENCDYAVFAELAATGHKTVSHEAKAPTCIEDGWNAYETCEKCDYSTYSTIPATGHDLESHAAKAPTCIEDGWNAYETCEKCDHSTYSTIPATGHDLESHAAKAPTCIENGWNAYETCENCEYSTYSTIPATGHDLESHAAKAPTCIEDGWNAYETCENCEYTTLVVIFSTGHEISSHPAKAPTCTEGGWTPYQTCSKCDYTTIVLIEATGHDIIFLIGKPATCQSEGWNDYEYCTKCNYNTFVLLPARDHNMIDGACEWCGYSESGIRIIDNEIFDYDKNGVRIIYNQEFVDVDGNFYYVIENIIIYDFQTEGPDGDSDQDSLSNQEEFNHGTDPFDPDTDNDGANDGKEVQIGFNPLVPNTSFGVSTPPIVDNSEEPDTVIPTIEIELSGDQMNTLVVERDDFFNKDTLGYLGDAYRYEVEGTFDSATIGFEFDQSKLNANSLPTIYSYDPVKGQMTPLTTVIVGNKATTDVDEFSTFVLLDRYVFEKQLTWVDVWGLDNNTKYNQVEIVFVIDDSGSMGPIGANNDPNNIRLTVSRDLVDQLPEGSKIGVVQFADSTKILTSGLITDKYQAKNYLTTNYFKSKGSTYMFTAMRDALSLYSTPSQGDSVFRVMIVLSDGIPSDENLMSSAVQSIQNKGISVYTVGLGTYSFSAFETYLKPVSERTGGKFYLSSNTSGLANIFDDIGEKIDLTTDSDGDGLLDYYEDNMVIFSGITYTANKNDPDTDDDGLLDGEEIRTVVIISVDGTKMSVIGKVFSDPSNPDSDGDGINDIDDSFPLNNRIA